jgi:alpha-ketoglutarate-dependent taurine dioxygenase
MKISFINQEKLPVLIEPSEMERKSAGFESLIAVCRNKREFFYDKLLKYGAVLFRGYKVQTAAEFAEFVHSFAGVELLKYIGGVSPRIELGGGVYTSTEYPSQYMLSLHNELSYSDKYPSCVYFCCLVAPQQGGETPIGDSRKILKSIAPEIVRELTSKKIRYDRNLFDDSGSGFSWQDAFETNDKSIVENYCRQSKVDFRWKENGGLWLSQIRPAVTTHPVTGEEVWFNQADGFHPSNLDQETYQSLIQTMSENEFRLNAFYGDGSPLDTSMLDDIRETLKKEMVIFPWQDGDILILDNLLTAHGRMPFSGARRIILAMT